jgi:hypothetical protein
MLGLSTAERFELERQNPKMRERRRRMVLEVRLMTLFDRFDPIDEGFLLGWGEVQSRHGGWVVEGGFGEWIGDGAEEVSVIDGDLDGLALTDDFLSFAMEAFERGAGEAGAIERVAGGADGRELGLGVGLGIFLGGNGLGDGGLRSSSLMVNHGIPRGIFIERELVDFDLDDPADVFVAVIFVGDEGW